MAPCPSPVKRRRYEGNKPWGQAASPHNAFDFRWLAQNGTPLAAGVFYAGRCRWVGGMGGKPLKLRISPEEYGGTARAPKGVARELWSS